MLAVETSTKQDSEASLTQDLQQQQVKLLKHNILTDIWDL